TSSTTMSCRVALPLFVTRNRYRTSWPTVSTASGVAVLTTLSDGVALALTTNDASAGGTATPDGSVPVAVAVSAIVPASRSAWVTVVIAMHVVEPPGASVVVGHVTTGAGSESGVVTTSVTVMPEMVTFPVLVTVSE